jgi:hypothetical protein
VDVAGTKERGPVRLVGPESLLGLNLGEVLLGLMETGEGQSEPTPAPIAADEGPVLRLRMPDGRVEREPLLGGFWRRDQAGGLAVPRIATRREGKALACKLYRVGEGRALYAGVLKAASARAFVEAAPGAEFRYRNAPLRRMTAGELAEAVDPDRVYDYDLLGAEGGREALSTWWAADEAAAALASGTISQAGATPATSRQVRKARSRAAR